MKNNKLDPRYLRNVCGVLQKGKWERERGKSLHCEEGEEKFWSFRICVINRYLATTIFEMKSHIKIILSILWSSWISRNWGYKFNLIFKVTFTSKRNSKSESSILAYWLRSYKQKVVNTIFCHNCTLKNTNKRVNYSFKSIFLIISNFWEALKMLNSSSSIPKITR